MEFRQIEHFLQLFESRNMTKAGEALFISQQGLSRSIKLLEDELALTLFEKSRRGAFPTIAGESLKPYFESLLRERDMLLSQVEKIKAQEPQQILHLACGIGFLHTSAANRLYEYEKTHPNIQLRCTEMTEDAVRHAIDTKLFDLALLPGPIQDNYLSRGIILKENLCAVMSIEHPLAKEESFRWSMGSSHDLFVEDQTSTLALTVRYHIKTQQVTPKSINETNHLFAELPRIFQRNGIALTLPSQLQYFNPEKIIVLPIEPSVSYEIHLVQKKDVTLNKATSDFANIITS